jgi:hypothetical protein
MGERLGDAVVEFGRDAPSGRIGSAQLGAVEQSGVVQRQAAVLSEDLEAGAGGRAASASSKPATSMARGGRATPRGRARQ